MEWIVSWLIATVALLITAKLIDGFHVNSFGNAFVAAAVIGLVNVFIKPVLVLLTLPITFLTLGLFVLVINAFLLKACAALVKGFDIEGWGPAFLGAIVLALVKVVLHWVF